MAFFRRKDDDKKKKGKRKGRPMNKRRVCRFCVCDFDLRALAYGCGCRVSPLLQIVRAGEIRR